MSTPFRFTKYDEPVESGEDAFGHGLATFLMGGGIVNPMGPTLQILAFDGLGDPGDRLKLCMLSFNPFSQSCHEVGEVVVGDEWVPARDLAPFFDGWNCCPTLLIPSALYSEKKAVELFAEFARSFPDGAKTLRQIRKHPGDPWTRVKEEMDGLPEMLKRMAQGDSSKDEAVPLDAEEAMEFTKLQLDPKNLKEEFAAFMFAWEGSQSFSGMSGVSKEDFLHGFTRLAMTARVPFMENIIDNPEMLGGDSDEE
jgi:hypothetical protein